MPPYDVPGEGEGADGRHARVAIAKLAADLGWSIIMGGVRFFGGIEYGKKHQT